MLTEEKISQMRAISSNALRQASQSPQAQYQQNRGVQEEPTKTNSFNPLDVVKGAVKGLGRTITEVGKLGSKGIEAVTNAVGIEPMNRELVQRSEEFSKSITTPETTAEKIGFAGEQIAEFFLPSSAVSKVVSTTARAVNSGKKATFIMRALAEATSDALVATAQTGGDLEQVKKTGLTSLVAFPAASAVLKGMGSLAKTSAAFIVSKTADIPQSALEYAFRNPETVQNAMRKFASESDIGLTQVAQTAREAMETLKDVRRKTYRSALENLPESANKLLSGEGVKETTLKALNDFNIVQTKDGLSFQKTAIPKSFHNDLKEIYERVTTWDDVSARGLDDLREVVGSYRKQASDAGNAKFNNIVTRITKDLNEYVGVKVPEIAEMNKTYSVQSDFIDEVKNVLSTETKNPTTLARKLNNVFSPRSQFYQPIVESLGEKAGVDIMSDLAGLIFSKWTAEGLGGKIAGVLGSGSVGAALLGSPQALATLPVLAATSSPRLIGEVVTTFSKLSETQIAEIVRALPRVARSAILKALQED